jgi:hypothetical protein
VSDVQWAQFPTDPASIKRDINVRRQAIRIMLAEIAALQEHLKQKMTPVDYLRYQAEEAKKAEADILGVVKEKRTDGST